MEGRSTTVSLRTFNFPPFFLFYFLFLSLELKEEGGEKEGEEEEKEGVESTSLLSILSSFLSSPGVDFK